MKSHSGIGINEEADKLAELGLRVQKGEKKTEVKPKHLKQLAKRVTESNIEEEVTKVAFRIAEKEVEGGVKTAEGDQPALASLLGSRFSLLFLLLFSPFLIVIFPSTLEVEITPWKLTCYTLPCQFYGARLVL